MPKKVYSNVKYGYQRNTAVEGGVTTILDYGNGATGIFVTCIHDIIGIDRFEFLGDKGKIVVDSSKKVTIKRLKTPETEIVLDGTPLLPPGSDRINSVALTNAIHQAG